MPDATVRIAGNWARITRLVVAAIGALAIVCEVAAPAKAQDGAYLPYDQNAPVGRIGQWSAQIGKGLGRVLQPIQIVLPNGGSVTVYSQGRHNPVELPAPAQVSVGIGFVYRLRIAGMPEFPGVELYPTVEMLDCLHPPVGREQDFPIPIRLTREEIQSAIDGRLITTVVYVEQPQLAVTGDLTQAMLNRVLPAERNLLIEADRVGRPVALVRLGGRTPDDTPLDDGFFGAPVPLRVVTRRPRVSDAEAGRALVHDRATTFTVAQPRGVIDGEDAIRLASRRGLSRPTSARPFSSIEPRRPPYELYPDEYLFDGGDRGYPVHVVHGIHEGLETEDAVAEFSDRAGKSHILPTNRVAIYAPRFGHLGTTSGPETGVTVDQLVGAVDTRKGQGLDGRVAAGHHAQRTPSQSVRVRSRADGFANEDRQGAVHQQTRLTENRELGNPAEDVQFESAPQMRQAQRAQIARKRAAAGAWTRTEFPVITASVAGLHEVSAVFVAEELVGVEDRRKPGRLEIVKFADKQTALPGEVVSFTIEYENSGDIELQNVRVVDNLTPRLELIANSATSSRPAEISVVDNGEGSSILSWMMKGPLPGRTKGSVTFQARVR